MRVITGTARGRKLKEPAGRDVRPTTDQVKEAIFNIVQFDIEGRRVLDLFAGSGQLGIEALSRGAETAVFVDNAPASLKLIGENLKLTGFEGRAAVVRGDSLEYLKRGEKFDLIFMDPPYASDLLDKALQNTIKFDNLKENGIIVCESKADKTLTVQSPYFLRKEYKYGKIKLTVFGRSADSDI